MARGEFLGIKTVEAKTTREAKRQSAFLGRRPVELQLDGPIPGDIEVFALTSALAIFTGGNIPNSNDKIPQEIHEKKLGGFRRA